MDANPPIELALALAPDVEPINGSLTAPGAPATDFTGALELLALIDAARERGATALRTEEAR